jgi:RNA polymerase sigma-70 factor (ECF subfamily)
MTFGKRAHSSDQLRARSDDELCKEINKGDHEAFLVLFDRYWLDVFRLARAVLRDNAEAEDLVQALFLEVHTTMLRYDERRGSFRTLLLRYAYTRAIDQRRHLESRRYYHSVQIEEMDQEILPGQELLTSGLTLDEGARLIEEGLQELDDKQRAAVTSYFFEGLSVNEIAEKLGDSYGNARHHLYRGLARMRKVLAPKEQKEESLGEAQRVSLRLENRLAKRVSPEVSGV